MFSSLLLCRPCFSAVPAKLLFVLSCLLLTSLKAHAGTYTWTTTGADGKITAQSPTYTGGIYTQPNAQGVQTQYPYKLTGSSYGGASGGAGAPSCTGTISTTFTWQPAAGQTMTTDPPPTVVVVTENCTVMASANRPGSTGSYDTGFSGAGQSGSVPFTFGGSNSATVSGVRYTSPAGGATVALSVSPSATANTIGAASSVAYSAAISPIFVNLSGVNPANQALTGQQITATLNGVPSGTKVTSYTWSFTGGTAPNPIKNWDPNGKAADGVTLQQLFPLTSADLTQTDVPNGNGLNVNPITISFYDQVADTVTVKCAANLTFPDSTTGSVNPTSVPVTFLKPTVTGWGIKSGIVRSPHGITGLFNVPGDNIYTDGQSWHDVVINVPSPFSGGQFSFGQTLTPVLTIYRELPQGSTASPYYVQTNNGINGLDTIFPYFTPFTIPNQPASKELTGDSPQVAIPDLNVTITVPPGDTGGTSWNKTTASDQFTTWLIYLPPGQSSIWVPLQTYSWSWSGTMINDAGWTQTAGSPTAGATPTASDTNTPPSWTTVHSASDAFKSP